MKEKLNSKDSGSLPKLIHEMKVLWNLDLSKKNLKSLSNSMLKRVHQVLQVKADAS
jgi:hypothetical protein